MASETDDGLVGEADSVGAAYAGGLQCTRVGHDCIRRGLLAGLLIGLGWGAKWEVSCLRFTRTMRRTYCIALQYLGIRGELLIYSARGAYDLGVKIRILRLQRLHLQTCSTRENVSVLVLLVRKRLLAS